MAFGHPPTTRSLTGPTTYRHLKYPSLITTLVPRPHSWASRRLDLSRSNPLHTLLDLLELTASTPAKGFGHSQALSRQHVLTSASTPTRAVVGLQHHLAAILGSPTQPSPLVGSDSQHRSDVARTGCLLFTDLDTVAFRSSLSSVHCASRHLSLIHQEINTLGSRLVCTHTKSNYRHQDGNRAALCLCLRLAFCSDMLARPLYPAFPQDLHRILTTGSTSSSRWLRSVSILSIPKALLLVILESLLLQLSNF